MADVRIRVIHSAGCDNVDVPDDITIQSLIRELIEALNLPKVDANDGQPLEYRLDSTDLGRRLLESETVAAIGLTPKDLLTLTVGVLAGSPKFARKSRISIVESHIGVSLNHLKDIDSHTLLTNEAALTMTLHAYRTTLVQLENACQDLKLIREENQQLSERLREKNIATLLLVLGQIQTGFGVNLITNNSTGGWLVFVAGLVWTTGALCFPFFARRKAAAQPETTGVRHPSADTTSNAES